MLQKIDGTINYPFFRIYSQAIINWLKRFNPLNRRLSEPQPLRVLYGNPERIFSDQNILPDNERIDIPVMTLYMTKVSPKPTWNIPSQIKFDRIFRLPNNQINDLYSYNFSKLKTFELQYEVDIMAEFKSDADYILFSMLREFSNNEIRYLQIYGAEGLQWIPVKLTDTTETSSLEPGNAQDLQIRWRLNLNVLNAYLPVSSTAELPWGNIVEEFNASIENQPSAGYINEEVSVL